MIWNTENVNLFDMQFPEMADFLHPQPQALSDDVNGDGSNTEYRIIMMTIKF